MKTFLCLVICLFVYTKAVDNNVASFITPCHASDRKCLMSTAQKAIPILTAGVPALGIKVMDPMFVDHVTSSEAGLNIDFRKTLVKGLKRCTVVDFKRQNPGKKVRLDLKCSVTLSGEYKLQGKLLTFNIEGAGTYHIKLTDLMMTIQFELGERKEGDETYWVMRSLQHSSHVQTNVHFQFNNLFNGNEALSHMIHMVANSNWGEIYKDVAPPVVSAIVNRIVEEIQKLFKVVPVRQLALD